MGCIINLIIIITTHSLILTSRNKINKKNGIRFFYINYKFTEKKRQSEKRERKKDNARVKSIIKLAQEDG